MLYVKPPTSTSAWYINGNTFSSLGCGTTSTIGSNVPTPFDYDALVTTSAGDNNFGVWIYGKASGATMTILANSYCKVEKNMKQIIIYGLMCIFL